MTRRLASLILCSGVAVLGSACATKSFVEKQVGAAERQLTLQIGATEATLTDRAGKPARRSMLPTSGSTASTCGLVK